MYDPDVRLVRHIRDQPVHPVAMDSKSDARGVATDRATYGLDARLTGAVASVVHDPDERPTALA
jgi:hypothetical protein